MAPQQTTHTNAPGAISDRYDIVAPIGSGTAANVFQVRDRRSGAVRAAKVLGAENARIPEVLARFENEYRILRGLHHPHLPQVHDYGWSAAGGRFLVMELVDGEPLDAYFLARPRDLWVILYELCEVLTFVHRHNLLHQDIKPSNILVTRTTAFGEEMPLVKLIDFGVTYRRDGGERVQMVGTPAYMAPEVALGKAPLTRAADHYSLGVTLYELLCGRVPFEGTVGEVLRAHIEATPYIEEEALEWAELYPHVRGLLDKDARKRLEAFEALRRAVTTRLTGGIAALDSAYGSARIESMGMIGKAAELAQLLQVTMPDEGERRVPRVSISGQPASGRSHFLETARSEWRIGDVSSWQLGDDSDATWLMNRPGDATAPPSEKDFEKAWARVAQSSRRGATWVVACGELTPEEKRLFEYIETGRTLAGPEVRRHLGFVTATALDTAASTPQGDGTVHITLPTVSKADLDRVTDLFRGEMLRTDDARLIADILKDARASGEIMRLLRRLIGEGGLVYEAQRWRVVAEKVREIAREPVSSGEPLVLSLTEVQQRVMMTLACHPGPVPVERLPGIAGLEEGAVRATLNDLRLRHLVESVDMSGVAAVRTTSRAVEQAVLRDVAADERAKVHARYVERLTTLDATAPNTSLRLLALHQEGSGDERSAYLTRRVLFKALWKKRAYGEIEQICRDAMSPKSLRFGLARAYLRELIKVLWAQNLNVRAYHNLKAFADRYGEVPKGLLPKYVRGLMDAEGSKVALEAIEKPIAASRKVSRALGARLEVEYALALHNMSRDQDGVAAIRRAVKASLLLSANERCRLLIYRVLIQTGLGHQKTRHRWLADALSLADAHGFGDEAVLIQIMMGALEVDRGRPDAALRVLARAMRTAVRQRLVLRHYQVMTQAATAYSELGDHERAIRCREKTVKLAQYLDYRPMLASSWWRVAIFAQDKGAFGNAVRYFDRAAAFLDESVRPADHAYAHILRHDLHAFIGSRRVDDLKQAARDALRLTSDVGEHGTLEIFNAARHLRSGQYHAALRAFAAARGKCIKGGRRDDVVSAAAGEARTMLMLGRIAECRALLRKVDTMSRGVTGLQANSQRYLTELMCQYISRGGRRELIRALRTCEAVVGKAYMSTRLEIYKFMARAYARLGMSRDAVRIAACYEEEIRSIVANLESEELARRFLVSVKYAGAMAEFEALARSSARISVDAGAGVSY